MRAFATYNNTTSNPENPNSPPRTVNLGESTTDEMMLVFFAFTQYQAGDENIIIDSSTITTGTNDPQITAKKLIIRPNPANAFILLKNPEQYKTGWLIVYDMMGRKMEEIEVTQLSNIQISSAGWANGVYQLQLQTSGANYLGKVVVQH